LFALAQAVEQRDRHTAGHCERIAFIGVSLGIAMGLDRLSLLALYRGGYLHDVGKVGIPDSILFKPGTLTGDEWVIMRSHSARGEEICRPLKSMSSVLPIIRHHHERWDGTGYPDGLRGEQIPLLARVLQMGDIYDALTNPRPYKPAFTPAVALRTIREETDRGWRDPEIVKLFVRLHKDVLAKAPQYTALTDRSLEAMRTFASQGTPLKLW
jgi:putative two-component system response regulator